MGKEVGYVSGFDEFDCQQDRVTGADPFTRALSSRSCSMRAVARRGLSRD